MKNLFILLVSIVALSTSSCSKEDSTPAPVAVETPKLEGKWIYSKEGSIANGQEVLTNYDHTTGCSKDFLQINSNGTGADNYYISNASTSCVIDADAFTYTKNNNTLTIIEPTETYTAEILLLSLTELKIKYSNGEIVLFIR